MNTSRAGRKMGCLGGVFWLALACTLSGTGETVEPTVPSGIPTSLPPTATGDPASTPEPVDPLVPLDTYASLATVRQRLNDMRLTRLADDDPLTGRQLLEWLLIDQQYDPTDPSEINTSLFAALDDYGFPNPGDRIYVVNVATGLFAEAQGLYLWSLADYTVQEIDNLFVQDSALAVTNPMLHRGDLPADMPNLRTHSGYPLGDRVVEDAHYRQFNLARRLAADAINQEEAVASILVWMQQNFFHAYDEYGWEVYLDGREPRSPGPAAYPQSLDRIYEERVVGCHEPTVMLEGMLHGLNIPAIRLWVHGHGVLYLPTLDRYVHGDHVANYTDAPWGVPLLTPDEFRPYAEDVAWIFDIYLNKYQSPFISVPLKRDGDELYIHAAGLRNYPETTCIQVSEEDWTRLSQQLSAYNIQYDDQACELTSDRVPILTLDELHGLGD